MNRPTRTASARVAIAFALLILPVSSAEEAKIDDTLLGAARKSLSATVGDTALQAAIASGLWNPAKTAVAVALHRSKGTVVYIFIRQATGDFLAVNASGVEGSNFGKLGSGPSYYERFETVPVEWLTRDDGKYQVSIRTRAWKNGRRYTVTEPLLINPDGTIWWR